MSKIENTLVEIPKGEIMLRDDRIMKEWRVEIDAFLLSKYLITQSIYEDVIKSNPSTFKGKQHPVENVTWLDAVGFCNALSDKDGLTRVYDLESDFFNISILDNANGYRLPTEAEWEYASRAGGIKNRYGELDDIAWYKTNANKSTHPVGLKVPNAWGIYDMLGNVWEWTSDIYDEEVYGEYRIFKGGGWYDEPRSVLSTNRRRSHPRVFKIDDLGFRISRSN